MVEIEKHPNDEFVVRHNNMEAKVTWEEMIGLVISLTIPLKSVIDGNTIGIKRPLTQYLKPPVDPILSQVDRNLSEGIIRPDPTISDTMPPVDNTDSDKNYVHKDYSELEEKIFNTIVERRIPMKPFEIGDELGVSSITVGLAIKHSKRLTKNSYGHVIIKPEMICHRD